MFIYSNLYLNLTNNIYYYRQFYNILLEKYFPSIYKHYKYLNLKDKELLKLPRLQFGHNLQQDLNNYGLLSNYPSKLQPLQLEGFRETSSILLKFLEIEDIR